MTGKYFLSKITQTEGDTNEANSWCTTYLFPKAFATIKESSVSSQRSQVA